MFNLIGGAAPTLVRQGLDGKRSNDEGVKPLTKKKSDVSQKESFRDVLKGSDPGQTNQKTDQREARIVSKTQDSESRSKSGSSETKDREVDKASPSYSRTKKSQGSKEQIFQEFMDSFESETGIPSARFAEALAQISQTSEGSKSPEETVDLVMDRLEIPLEKEEKVRSMYLGFLAHSKNESSNAGVVLSNLEQLNMGNNDHMLQRLEESQRRRTSLNENLDQLNQRFWMTRANAGQAEDFGNRSSFEGDFSLKNDLSGGGMAANMNHLIIDDEVSEKLIGLGIDPQSLTQNELNSLKDSLSRSSLEVSGDPVKPTSSNAELNFLSEVEQLLEERLQAGEPLPLKHSSAEPVLTEEALFAMDLERRIKSTSNRLEGGREQGEETLGSTDEAFASSLVVGNKDSQRQDSFESYLNQGSKGRAGSSISSVEGFDAAMEDQGRVDFSLDPALVSGQDFGRGDSQLGPPVVPGSMVASSSAPGGAERSSVSSVIQQAQYLVKQGGGEMTVKMTPEGLGEVTIRVTSENGKMNVQIATESAEAKRLFDSSLSDLKNHLNAQKLSTEMVKVDVIQSANSDQNVQSNLNQQQQNFSQQQTRQFWNQFQENFGNRSQRESYLDFSNSRRSGEKDKDPLQPIETKSRVSSRAFENKGRGLNLVA